MILKQKQFKCNTILQCYCFTIFLIKKMEPWLTFLSKTLKIRTDNINIWVVVCI